jgi:hypothetical protein
VKIAACALALTFLAIAAPPVPQPDFHPNIPKAWDDKEVESMELPLAQRDRSPRYMTSAEYYALKVRPIYLLSRLRQGPRTRWLPRIPQAERPGDHLRPRKTPH